MDLFTFDAAQQHEEQRAARHASILFTKRASERYEGFLRQAADKSEFQTRVALVQDEMAALAEETGGDGASLTSSFIERIAGGAFCDDCHKWKVGPKSLCQCGSDSENGEGALSDDVSAVGKGSSVKVAEDGLGGKGTPSPKMDKATWDGLEPIDTDGEHFKTRHQDVSDVPDHEKSIQDQTDLDLDHNADITKVDNQPVIHTDTWSGTEGQANPVTSGFLSAAEIQQILAAE